MIIEVKYGLTISYYSMIETGKGGSVYLDINIVDLENNSILFKDLNINIENFNGKWDNPPYYPELKANIETALNKSVEGLKNKF